MNRRAKFDTASFSLGGEIRNRKNTHAHAHTHTKLQTNSNRHVWITSRNTLVKDQKQFLAVHNGKKLKAVMFFLTAAYRLNARLQPVGG